MTFKHLVTKQQKPRTSTNEVWLGYGQTSKLRSFTDWNGQSPIHPLLFIKTFIGISVITSLLSLSTYLAS